MFLKWTILIKLLDKSFTVETKMKIPYISCTPFAFDKKVSLTINDGNCPDELWQYVTNKVNASKDWPQILSQELCFSAIHEAYNILVNLIYQGFLEEVNGTLVFINPLDEK